MCVWFLNEHIVHILKQFREVTFSDRITKEIFSKIAKKNSLVHVRNPLKRLLWLCPWTSPSPPRYTMWESFIQETADSRAKNCQLERMQSCNLVLIIFLDFWPVFFIEIWNEGHFLEHDLRYVVDISVK